MKISIDSCQKTANTLKFKKTWIFIIFSLSDFDCTFEFSLYLQVPPLRLPEPPDSRRERREGGIELPVCRALSKQFLRVDQLQQHTAAHYPGDVLQVGQGQLVCQD